MPIRAKARTVRQYGTQNATERLYQETVLRTRKAAGEILCFRFEAHTLKLAQDTRYTPDFEVILADGTIEFHEIKAAWLNKSTGKYAGHYEDDAKVKIKVAAELFPEYLFRGCYHLPKKAGGGWLYEEF
jgi:hypothetical protein